ncbi:MAG: hypothetical protein GF347_00150 [Candidatus Moranbacteria bacterium]|nr:hypothetical protein [Candidatus Moranbacteria bacterium]
MELKAIIKIIKKNLKLILIFTLGLSLIVVFANNLIKTTYKATFSLNVVQEGVDKTQDYKFDNYYALKSIDDLTESLEKWFDNPDLTIEILNQSEILDQNKAEIKNARKFFKARKTAPNYIEVSFKFQNREKIVEISENLVSIINQKLGSQKKQKEVWYSIQSSKPYVEEARIGNLKLGALSILTNFIIIIMILITRDYLKSDENRS